jgi:hypothetical protein
VKGRGKVKVLSLYEKLLDPPEPCNDLVSKAAVDLAKLKIFGPCSLANQLGLSSKQQRLLCEFQTLTNQTPVPLFQQPPAIF